MKTIERDEIYQNLGGFLKAKGIELREGAYSKRIQKCCSLLTDAINVTQRTVAKAKSGVDAKLDKMRQVIHEKTAPKNPAPATPTPAAPEAAAPAPPAAAAVPEQPPAATNVPSAAPPVARKPRKPAAKPRQAARKPRKA